MRDGGGVWSLDFANDGHDNFRSAFLDAASGGPLDVSVPEGAKLDDVSRDGRLAAAEQPDGSVGLLDLGSGQQVGSLPSDRGGDWGQFAPTERSSPPDHSTPATRP